MNGAFDFDSTDGWPFAVSPDGKSVMTVVSDRKQKAADDAPIVTATRFRVLDARTGEVIRELAKLDGLTTGFAVSPDGRRLVLVSRSAQGGGCRRMPGRRKWTSVMDPHLRRTSRPGAVVGGSVVGTHLRRRLAGVGDRRRDRIRAWRRSPRRPRRPTRKQPVRRPQGRPAEPYRRPRPPPRHERRRPVPTRPMGRPTNPGPVWASRTTVSCSSAGVGPADRTPSSASGTCGPGRRSKSGMGPRTPHSPQIGRPWPSWSSTPKPIPTHRITGSGRWQQGVPRSLGLVRVDEVTAP